MSDDDRWSVDGDVGAQLEFMIATISSRLIKLTPTVLEAVLFGSATWKYPPVNDINVAIRIKRTSKKKVHHTNHELSLLTKEIHDGMGFNLSITGFYHDEKERWERLVNGATNVKVLF